MGLRQPKDLLNTKASAPIRTTDVRPLPSAGQIDTGFINTLQRANQAEQKALANKREKMKKFMLALFENDADIERITREQELSSLDGVGAIEKAPSIKKRYFDNLKNRFGAIPEDFRSDPDFRLSLIKKASQFDRFSIPYLSGESNQVEDDAYKSRIANDMNIAVENAVDIPYLQNDAIPQLEKSIYQDLSRKYGTDPTRQIGNTTAGKLIVDEMNAGVSGTITKVIEQQVLVDDFGLAQQTLQTFRDRITPEDLLKIDKIINRGLKDSSEDHALALANQTLNVLGSEASMVKVEEYVRARSGSDADLYNKSLSILRGRQKIIDTQKERDYQDIEADTYDRIIRGREYDHEAFKQLPPARRDRLFELIDSNNGGPATITDHTRLNEINDFIDRLPDDEFIKMDINKLYQKDLSAKDRNVLLSRQRKVRAELKGDIRQGQRWDSSVYRSAARDFVKANSLYDEEADKVEAIAAQEYQRLIDENPNLTKTELNKRLRKSLYDRAFQEVDNPSFFDKVGQFFGMDVDVNKKTVLGETVAPQRDMAIHPSWVKTVQEARIKRGEKTMKEPELMRFFQSMQQRNPNINLSEPPQ